MTNQNVIRMLVIIQTNALRIQDHVVMNYNARIKLKKGHINAEHMIEKNV